MPVFENASRVNCRRLLQFSAMAATAEVTGLHPEQIRVFAAGFSGEERPSVTAHWLVLE